MFQEQAVSHTILQGTVNPCADKSEAYHRTANPLEMGFLRSGKETLEPLPPALPVQSQMYAHKNQHEKGQ